MYDSGIVINEVKPDGEMGQNIPIVCLPNSGWRLNYPRDQPNYQHRIHNILTAAAAAADGTFISIALAVGSTRISVLVASDLQQQRPVSGWGLG